MTTKKASRARMMVEMAGRGSVGPAPAFSSLHVGEEFGLVVAGRDRNGRIVKRTEKAARIEVENAGRCWLPLSALRAEPEAFVPVSGTNVLAWYHVEPWFLRSARPEQAKVLG